jgi:hypothetical protein
LAVDPAEEVSRMPLQKTSLGVRDRLRQKRQNRKQRLVKRLRSKQPIANADRKEGVGGGGHA